MESKPLFYGLGGLLVLGGAAYLISRDTDDKTVVSNATASTNEENSEETNTGTTPVSNPVIPPVDNTVPVIVFLAESNAGTQNASSTLNAGEGGLRTGVRILNNDTNQLEQLNVGVNNFLGENAAIANGWGWENQLANLRASGAITKDIVIIKAAQGGATIGQFNDDILNGYFSIFKNRVNTVKAALASEGKTPVFSVFYSQGINNANAQNLDDQGHFPNLSGIQYWEAATRNMFVKVRNELGQSTKICATKFWGSYGSYLNDAIDRIVNDNTAINSSVFTSDLGIQGDGLHLDAPGSRTLTNRLSYQVGLTASIVA